MVSSQLLKGSEVMHMLEELLLKLLILSLVSNIALAIISLILIIVFSIITYKENRISADR